jgi:hypothetical protein
VPVFPLPGGHRPPDRVPASALSDQEMMFFGRFSEFYYYIGLFLA